MPAPNAPIGYLVPTANAYPGARYFQDVNSTLLPFVNPVGGVFVYSEGGVLKALLPGGAIVPLTASGGGLYVKKNALQDAATDYAAFGAAPALTAAVNVDAASFATGRALGVKATSGRILRVGIDDAALGAYFGTFSGHNFALLTNSVLRWSVPSDGAGIATLVSLQGTMRFIGGATANQIRDAADASNNASWTDAGVWTFRSDVIIAGSGFLLWPNFSKIRSAADGTLNLYTNTGLPLARLERGAAGDAASIIDLNKTVTAIANGVATAAVTVTIPNSVQTGTLRVTLKGALGAGGAIGADEATGTVTYDIAIARTAGVNAVAVASAAFGASSAAVAGAATITVTAAVSAIAGAVGADNTFTVNVTITAGSGASTNHTCMVFARLLNGRASGITIA